jgi:hypothetical protein
MSTAGKFDVRSSITARQDKKIRAAIFVWPRGGLRRGRPGRLRP